METTHIKRERKNIIRAKKIVFGIIGFENGQLSDSGKYKEGKMLEVWKYYNEEGVFIEQKNF